MIRVIWEILRRKTYKVWTSQKLANHLRPITTTIGHTEKTPKNLSNLTTILKGTTTESSNPLLINSMTSVPTDSIKDKTTPIVISLIMTVNKVVSREISKFIKDKEYDRIPKEIHPFTWKIIKKNIVIMTMVTTTIIRIGEKTHSIIYFWTNSK